MNNTHPTPMRSARWWMVCLTLMLCTALGAQNKIEYFWNIDPGMGNGATATVTDGAVAIATDTLPIGANLLGIRAIDGEYYSTTLLRTIFKVALLSETAKVEYFWDTDPGIGNGTDYPVTLSGSDEATLTLAIPTDTVSNGAHLLGLRVYNGTWSHTYHYIMVVANNGALADKVEYFWDIDPGMGNAIQQSLTLNETSGTAALTIPTDTLKGGVHLLGMRVGSGDTWSSTTTRIIAIAPNEGIIERLEYFWDTDPGMGNATEYALNASNNGNAMVSLSLPTDTLSTGVHLLGLRSYCGGWSVTLLRYVAVSANGGAIERVEYFWDTDPGYGQATELPYSGDTLAIVNTDIVSPTAYGSHVLNIRAFSNGMWSAPYIQHFCMNATPGMQIDKDTVCVGEQFIVYNMTEGATDSTTYSWDMNGDGTVDSTTGEEFVYSYTKAGTYMASLSVKTVGDCATTCYVPIVVLPTDKPTVTLSAATKKVCAGQAVRLQATAKNAGDHPEYEWLVNDEVVATTTVDTLMMEGLADYDKVQVRVISSNPCAAVDNALSSQITFRVNPLPEVSIAHYFPIYKSESSLILTGGVPEGGIYYINDKEAALFNPARNEVGTYSLRYSYTNSNGCTSEALTSFVLREAALVQGDVNKDETVDVMDILCEVDLIYGRTFPTYTLATADLNGDTKVDVADIVGISGIILGDQAAAQARAVHSRMAQGRGATNALAIADAHAARTTEVMLHFNLSAAQAVCGLQFDITLPEGVELTSATKGLVVGRKAGAQDNTYTLLAYSTSLAALPGTLAVKATLPVGMSRGVYTLAPEEVTLVDASMDMLSCTIGTGKLYVGEATGMAEAEGGIQVSVSDGGLHIVNAAGKVAMLTDAAGRLVLAEELAGNDCLIPLSALSAGTYMVEIVDEYSPVKVKFLWK